MTMVTKPDSTNAPSGTENGQSSGPISMQSSGSTVHLAVLSFRTNGTFMASQGQPE